MFRQIAILKILFLIILSSFLSLAYVPGVFPDAPNKRALLIGIDKYKSGTISNLRGAVNDVELMRQVLVGKFNIPPENIKVLKNEEATRAGIINAIKTHLIEPAKSGDVVILHYSGHGSQMIDEENGDEIDGKDETLVPHDSRTEGVFDINDDMINGLLSQLTARTKNVTFIFDSCHSGATARGGNTVRKIEPDLRPPPPPEVFAVTSRGIGEGNTDIRLNGADYVLISGSLASELSNETLFNGRRHGVLTWFLAQALQQAAETTTYRDVMDTVAKEVQLKYPSQHPQIEGPGKDVTVFGTDKINTRPYVLVDPDGSDSVRVWAGKVYGLRKDSLLKVYSPGTSDYNNNQPIATIKVTFAKDFTATANVVEGGPVKPGSRALLDATAFGDTSIPIFIDVRRSESISKIKDSLKQMTAITLLDDDSGARLVIRKQEGKITVESGDLEVMVPPVPLAEEGHVERVVNQVKDLAHWLTVLDLRNPSPNLDISFSFRRKSDPPDAPVPRDVAPGTYLTYRVENRDDVPLYIYVLDVSSDGSISLLYPRISGEQQALPPKTALEQTVETYLPEDRSAVVDVLKVIATITPINASVFPQGAIRTAPPPADTRALQDPLTKFLSGAVRAERGSRPVEVKSWITVQKSFRVRKAGANLSGFSLHFEASKEVKDISNNLSQSKSVCSQEESRASADCFELIPASKDGTVFEAAQKKSSRGMDDSFSVGQAFDEAYRIQDETGARRVEPLLNVQVPGIENEQGIDKRGISGDNKHDDAAKDDDQWSLKQIRVMDAWKKIRGKYNVSEGQEAAGVLIAHIDTGYRGHPETWTDVGGKRPIDKDKGHDFYDDDDDPLDPLLSDSFLDNPGHGTASGSVIVSPPGCQLEEADGCVNGIARGARLVPLRVHRTVSQFNMRYMARAIRSVAEGNVKGDPKLITIAMGGPPTLTLWKAVKRAEKNGVLIVAAAGNYVRTVVWPARFKSTIAVAANNVRCRHWKHSSRGNKVDISAPGESVWRATLNKNHEYINAMGKGTTFATGNTTGTAALWLAWHRDNPKMDELRQQGLVTKAFRHAVQSGSWRPGADPASNPPGTICDSFSWDPDYGTGIINVAALLDVPLEVPEGMTRALDEVGEIPLFSSLYPEGTNAETIRKDYVSLFGGRSGETLERLSSYETEILYHYTVDEQVQRNIDGMAQGQRGDEPYERVREALFKRDLSKRLREVLNN